MFFSSTNPKKDQTSQWIDHSKQCLCNQRLYVLFVCAIAVHKLLKHIKKIHQRTHWRVPL